MAQEQRRARGGLQHFERLAHAAAGEIDLVEEDDARHAELFELAQDDLQRRRLARVGFAHHHRRVADRQDVAHVVNELDRTGTIDEGEAVAHVVDAGDVRLDAHRVRARFGAGIADAGAVAHRALPRRAARPDQQALEQAGFAALEWTDDRDQPRSGNSALAILTAFAHRTLLHDLLFTV